MLSVQRVFRRQTSGRVRLRVGLAGGAIVGLSAGHHRRMCAGRLRRFPTVEPARRYPRHLVSTQLAPYPAAIGS